MLSVCFCWAAFLSSEAMESIAGRANSWQKRTYRERNVTASFFNGLLTNYCFHDVANCSEFFTWKSTLRAERFFRLLDFVVLKKYSAKIASFSTPAVPFFLAHDNVTESKVWGLGSTMKSSKNFVKDVLHVARIQFPRSIAERLVQQAQLWSSLYQYKNARGWKNSLRRKNKIDQFGSGYGDFKGMTRFSQSLFFSVSIM